MLIADLAHDWYKCNPQMNIDFYEATEYTLEYAAYDILLRR